MQEIYNAILGHVPERIPIFIVRTDIAGPGSDQNQRRRMPVKVAKPEYRLAPDWPDQNTL